MNSSRTNRKRIGAIISALLLFAALVSVVLAFTMSAEVSSDSKTAFTVESKNIELGDELRILYKVADSTGDDSLDVKMYFWYTAPSSYDVRTAHFVSEPATEAEKAAVNAADADYVFFSPGIPQSSMTEYLYAVVYAEADGYSYSSEPVRYSVLDYVYQRRAEHAAGIKIATGDQLALYTATLRAGGAAQKYLGDNTTRLANAKYAKVEVVGGTLADGFTSGLFTGGEKIELVAPALDSEDRAFLKWVDGDGKTVSTERECTATMAKVTVGYPDETPTVTYTAVYGISDDASAPTYIDGTPVFVTPSHTTATDLVINPDKFGTDSKVITFVKNGTGTGAGVKSVPINKSTDESTADDVYVFEGNFYVEDCVNGTSGNHTAITVYMGDSYRLEISLAKSSFNGTSTMMLWDSNLDGGRNFICEVENAIEPETINWMKLRVEFYNAEQIAKIYLDGSLIAISENAYYSHDENTRVSSYSDLYVSLNDNSSQTSYVHGLKAEITEKAFSDDGCERVLASSYESTTYADGWVVVENSLSTASVNALKSLYAFYDDPDKVGDEAWRWVARLYDAEIGAFYYATSGKYSEGYLPDTEATSQALSFLANSGIFSTQQNNAKTALDTISEYINETNKTEGIHVDLRNDIAAFAYSRMASDGYTRHPQWTHTLEAAAARIGRDHSNSSTLRDYGTGADEQVTVLDNVSSTAAAVSYMMSGASYITVPLTADYNHYAMAMADDTVTEGTLPATIEILEDYIENGAGKDVVAANITLGAAMKSVNDFISYIHNKSKTMSTVAPGDSGYVASHGYGHGMSSSQSIIRAAEPKNLKIGEQTYVVQMADVYIAYMNVWQKKMAVAAYEAGFAITGMWELEYFDTDRDGVVYTADASLAGTTFELGGKTYTYTSDKAEFSDDTTDYDYKKNEDTGEYYRNAQGGNRQYYTELSGLYKIGSFYNGAKQFFNNTKISEIVTDETELAAYRAKFNIPEHGFEMDENGNYLEYGFVDAMIDRCIMGILGEAETVQFVHIYNPWLALNTVLTRLRAANTAAGYEMYDIDAIIEYIRGESDIVDGQNRTERMIAATIEKIAPFRCVDGSFSYFKQYSDPATQGTPVGVGTKEGDINATALAANGMRGAIFAVLGLTRPALFDGQADFDEFKELIATEELKAYDGPLEGKGHLEHILEFEYDEINTYFVNGTDLELVAKNEQDKYIVLKDGDSSGHSVSFDLTEKLHNTTTSDGILPHVVDYNNISYAMFEADFYIDWASAQPSDTGFQITLGTANAPLYMLTLNKTSDGKILVGDAKNQNVLTNTLFDQSGNTIKINDAQWFTVKVEYRVESGAAEITVTVTEADRSTVHTGTSTNVYDGVVKTDLKLQSGSDKMLSILARTANVTDLAIDNLSYGYASVPAVATTDGVTVKGETSTSANEKFGETIYTSLAYGETVTLRAPKTDANGAPFTGFKRNTGMLSIFEANVFAQTAECDVKNVTLDNLPAWFEKTGVSLGMGELVGDCYELEVVVPAGATTYSATYDTKCTVTFENVEDKSEFAPENSKYPAGDFTFSAPLRNAEGQLFDHWELDGVTVSYAATATVNLPVGGNVKLTAVYSDTRTETVQDFTGTDKNTDIGDITFGKEDPTGEGRDNVMIHDMTEKLSPASGGSTPVSNKFATTAASTKVLSFDMYMPKATDASVYTDYFNESTSFAGLYQITLSYGGKKIAFFHVSAPNAGTIDGYYLGIASNTSYTENATYDDTLLYFDQWYHVSIEMVFAADEGGAYTVPAYINVYVNDRFLGRTDIFFYAENYKDGVLTSIDDASVDYAAVSAGDLTISNFFAPMRSKSVGYFDNLSYYESNDAAED